MLNTFRPNPIGAPAAPLLTQPSITDLRDPMQQLAALMAPQASGGGMGSSILPPGLGGLLQMLKAPGGGGITPLPAAQNPEYGGAAPAGGLT